MNNDGLINELGAPADEILNINLFKLNGDAFLLRNAFLRRYGDSCNNDETEYGAKDDPGAS